MNRARRALLQSNVRGPNRRIALACLDSPRKALGAEWRRPLWPRVEPLLCISSRQSQRRQSRSAAFALLAAVRPCLAPAAPLPPPLPRLQARQLLQRGRGFLGRQDRRSELVRIEAARLQFPRCAASCRSARRRERARICCDAADLGAAERDRAQPSSGTRSRISHGVASHRSSGRAARHHRAKSSAAVAPPAGPPRAPHARCPSPILLDDPRPAMIQHQHRRSRCGKHQTVVSVSEISSKAPSCPCGPGRAAAPCRADGLAATAATWDAILERVGFKIAGKAVRQPLIRRRAVEEVPVDVTREAGKSCFVQASSYVPPSRARAGRHLIHRRKAAGGLESLHGEFRIDDVRHLMEVTIRAIDRHSPFAEGIGSEAHATECMRPIDRHASEGHRLTDTRTADPTIAEYVEKS